MAVERNMQKTGVLIAAAGMSSRMGTFKPLLPLGDETLISYQLNKFVGMGLSPIVIVTGNEAERLEHYIKEYKKNRDPEGKIVCIRNEQYHSSEMFDTIKIGLKRIKGQCDRFFVLPADIPLFSEKTLNLLLRSEGKVTKPVFQNRGGHPLLIRSDMIDQLIAYTGEMGLKGALQAADIEIQNIEVMDEGILIDADTLEDYQKVKEYVKRKECLAYEKKFLPKPAGK